MTGAVIRRRPLKMDRPLRSASLVRSPAAAYRYGSSG